MFKKTEFLLILKDRAMVALLLGVAFGSLVVIGISLLQLQISDVQVPIRYSDYGLTNIYRDKWYSLLTFTAWGICMLILNSLIGIKLYSHSHYIAKGFLVVSLFVVVVGVIVTGAVFRLASLSV